MNEKMFTSMPPDCRRFYQKIYNRAVLNLWAVRNGLFDTILCQTEDPNVTARWEAALPRIIAAMDQQRNNILKPPE